MWHKQRTWTVEAAVSPEWLAEALTQSTWCGCQGFALGKYRFVNDATCADGAQEYAVLRAEGDGYVQIESLTFSWMNTERALQLIRRVLAGDYDTERYGFIPTHQLQIPAQHGICSLCS